jgi:hypothetical protein
MVKSMDGTIAPELKAYHARKAKTAKDEAIMSSGENLPSPEPENAARRIVVSR